MEEHLFMHCPAACQVWFASPLSLRVDNFLTFADFWRHIHELHDSEVMALVQTTIYMMWEARNHHQFQQRPSSTEHILQRVASVQAEVRIGASAPATIERNVAWRGPVRGTYKCNFDASFVDGRPVGLGMVVRKHRGEVMASACSYPVHVTTPILAEAMSMRWSLQLFIDLGFRRISLETDFSVMFVRRKSNAVADFLAKSAEAYTNMVWVEEVPLAAAPLIDADVMNLLPVGL
ncbi:uncharacterized protein LOC130737146 [Lotus japonicus]|uniref:uncharacterized protein LOC130737146 n=1 Tax=Lotus japonicus TaxID=34305 RepID=UPI002584FB73|nr:uncharacterized protein LOC130737146 [Lotus japonicus]